MAKSKLLKIAALTFAVFLVGCSSTGSTQDGTSSTEETGTEEVATDSTDGSETGEIVVDGDTDGETIVVETTGESDSMEMMEVKRPMANVLYFDFDKANVKAQFRNVLDKHGDYLAANPDRKVILEGHADERGTREYNLALGERRAYAVSAYLKLKGVGSDQIEIVSFGEEKPVDLGKTMEAYSQNRRVEIQYQN